MPWVSLRIGRALLLWPTFAFWIWSVLIVATVRILSNGELMDPSIRTTVVWTMTALTTVLAAVLAWWMSRRLSQTARRIALVACVLHVVLLALWAYLLVAVELAQSFTNAI